MKGISFLTILITLSIVISLLLSGCGHESNLQESNEVSGVSIDYISGYQIGFGDLADAADLIALGTITGTVEVVPHETLEQVWQTKSAFHVEKSFKGDYSDEIIIIQTGAVGKGEDPDNPVFEAGERCFLFLSKGKDDIYRLVDPHGRFRIEEGRVSSLNYVLTREESQPPDDLQFRKADMNVFISLVIEAIKSGYTIPDEEPVIVMDLFWMMSGIHDVLSIYKDGTTIYIKQWGLRRANPDNPAIRVWRVGKITTKTVENLFDYLDSVGLNDLEKYPEPLDPNTQSGVSSDLLATLSANNGDIDNKVIAEGYFTPESDNPYQKLPYPIDEIYTKLITIAEEETKEAYREEIERDISYEDPY